MTKREQQLLLALIFNQGLWLGVAVMWRKLYRDVSELNSLQDDLLQLFDKKIMEHCPDIYLDPEVQTFMFNTKARYIFEEEGL